VAEPRPQAFARPHPGLSHAGQQPSLEALAQIAANYGFEIASDRLEKFRALIGQTLGSYARLDELVEPTLPVKYPRKPGYRPSVDDNPLGAWYWKSQISGAAGGPLAAKTVAIKDNVCVAGVPDDERHRHARGLRARGGRHHRHAHPRRRWHHPRKEVCESLCFSGGSHTGDTGPVRNPYDLTRITGGSSSGSAALLASGEVDMAIGGDQGGSVRIPSCWCGTYGLKPTYGLVPYTGVFPIELTLDHVGPIARSAADAALLLEAIAGPDGLDPRQTGGLTPHRMPRR
jgi:amidase